MPNPTGTATSRPRHVAAAARAAAKRAERARTEEPPEDQDVAPAPEPERAPEPSPGLPRGRRRTVVTAVLALVAVAGLTAAAVLGRQYEDERRTDAAGTQAVAAARKAAPVVLSYDYRHLTQDFAKARTWLTGGFRDEYQKTTTTVVAPAATKYHGVVTAMVAGSSASVVSASPDRVEVLLFVNQVTRSTQLTAPRVDLNRVRMTLSRTSSGWKVSAVDAL